MITSCTKQLLAREDLSAEQCNHVIDAIMQETIEPTQIAAILSLLAAKGETAAELHAFIEAVKKYSHMQTMQEDFLDIVGTGGDGMNTVNISTAASIVVASCGVKIAKHGNRSVSSRCGSADVLEKLGVVLDLESQQVKRCIEKVGIGFCFAPLYHPTFKKIKTVRTSLGIPTVFNLMGPLLNPFSVPYYLFGVNKSKDLHRIADALMLMKIKKALVVHGSGMDELNLLGPIQVIEVDQDVKKEMIIDPLTLGFKYCHAKDIVGADPETNAQLILEAFERKKGPLIDTILLNAAAGLYVVGKASTLAQGLEMARDCVNANKPCEKLNAWVSFCQQC